MRSLWGLMEKGGVSGIVPSITLLIGNAQHRAEMCVIRGAYVHLMCR
jgi:hypothetical protein